MRLSLGRASGAARVGAALLVVGLAAWGCGTKCDELADELGRCPTAGEGGSGGGDTGDECTEVEEQCANCMLEQGAALCDPKAFQETQAACAADCPP